MLFLKLRTFAFSAGRMGGWERWRERGRKGSGSVSKGDLDGFCMACDLWSEIIIRSYLSTDIVKHESMSCV